MITPKLTMRSNSNAHLHKKQWHLLAKLCVYVSFHITPVSLVSSWSKRLTF